MVAAAMGTTGLSYDDRWWAVAYKVGSDSELAIVDTETGQSQVMLRRDSISHVQFCPDDPDLLFYAGPLTETVLLGTVALRCPGQTLNWDATHVTITNRPEANRFVRRSYREGWEIT